MTRQEQYREAIKRKQKLRMRIEKLRQEGEQVHAEYLEASQVCEHLREHLDAEILKED